jgi:hypothetical protein
LFLAAVLCCAAPAAARADGPGAAGRASQDVPGAQQDPLQGRQRRAQGNSLAFLFSDFNLVPGPDLLTVRLLPPCVSAPVLQAETETDEMYAQITLQPEPDVSTDTEWTDWTTIILLATSFSFWLLSALQMPFLLSLPNSAHLLRTLLDGIPPFMNSSSVCKYVDFCRQSNLVSVHSYSRIGRIYCVDLSEKNCNLFLLLAASGSAHIN